MSDNSAHRILIIDDQSAIHEDYRKILGRQASSSTALGKVAAELFGDEPGSAIEWEGFELDSAFQGQEGVKLVQQSIAERRPYSVAFVDIRMPPGWDGIETVRHIWEIDPEILVVICSAYSDYSWQEMVGQLGRNDRYLILKKPFDNIEVRQCAMALSERWSVSRTDVLTGLLNRRAFRSYLDLEWGRAARHRIPLACAMVDLDCFKRVNDTAGHQAGDLVLKNVARTLQLRCRANDSVCRYGGEELCVLLPHTTEQEATVWAENARRDLEASPTAIGDRAVPVTASIGVAERLAENDSTERLIERADQALMRAKAMGRNRVVSYSTISPPVAASDNRRPPLELWKSITLREVMTAPVISIRATALVRDAAQAVLQLGISYAPVVDADGKLIGVFSENDLLGILANPDAWSMPVEGIMRREVVSYELDTPLKSICEFLSWAAVQRVIIVRDGCPVGVVARRNLLRYLCGRVGPSEHADVVSALHLSGEIDSERLLERARTLALRAAQLPDSLLSAVGEPVVSLVANLGALQRHLDDVLAPEGDSSLPPVVGLVPDSFYFPSASGPLAPLG